MGELEQLKVVRFTLKRIPNPYPDGDLPWQVYHTVRNAIVRTCRRHGPTGPMGECIIEDSRDFPDIDGWERGDKPETYFIVDDQYNDERYLYAEVCDAGAFSREWLAEIIETLQEHPGWAIGIKNLPDSYLLIFGNKLMVHGKPFRECCDAESVIKVVRRQIRRGNKKWWQFWR
jgi:hypothetical protein